MMPTPEVLAAIERAKKEEAARKLAASYRECFASEPGQRVLADLLEQFPPDRPRFSTATGFDPVKAAVADGQSQVTLHIESWRKRVPAEPKEKATNLTDQ
jgi:hypothetical protein